jgi:hypothetical protein
MLRGRRDECAVLDRLLEGARVGRSAVLVLNGEAAVGRTAFAFVARGATGRLGVILFLSGGKSCVRP